ncbi:hypothetical protein GRI69_10240 [Erythrobacter vulgaris]|uniref:SIR2-like domain-containing protein n=1 Tax=Qipengyuania vulgaris TaxID=291985 RepID=A0A844XTT0_9SPHN|nr:SIR2 family protein [Qipengyuania vulgaris]MXO48637.1 hypothetical protein [Qipengyuania vulgaris]
MDPSNLSKLATLVFEKTGGQDELIRRFPVKEMRAARPNSGYKLLVALMVERAVSHVLSLNFDRAVENAAIQLGQALNVVTEHSGHVPMTPTLIYLHGSADSPPRAWVLREDTMTEGWKGQWEEVIANQILSAPRILFAGLGSAAPVLEASVSTIQKAIGDSKQIFQADYGPLDSNFLAKQLGVTAERYIQGSWSEVLSKLSERLVSEQLEALRVNGRSNLQENDFSDIDQQRFLNHVDKLATVSLLALGRMRAFAQLDGTHYRRHSELDDLQVAEPLTRLAQIAEELALQVRPTAHGSWQILRDGRVVGNVMLASGGGVRRFAAIEPRVRQFCTQVADEVLPPDVILIGGIIAETDFSPPSDIVADTVVDSLIDGPSGPLIVSANAPDMLAQVGELLNVA